MTQTPSPPSPPALWNPDAAVNWSLLFTPAFGAYLHACNAEALGRAGEARANWIWFSLSLAWIAATLAGTFVPAIGDGWYHAGSIGLLLGWYFSLGKKQAYQVKGGYSHKPWTRPLLIGVAGLAVYLALAYLLLLTACWFGITA